MVVDNHEIGNFLLVIMLCNSAAATELSGSICSPRFYSDVNGTFTEVFLFYSTSTLREMRLRLAGLNMRDNASRGKSKFYKNLDACRRYYCINHLKRKQSFMSFSQGFFTGFILFFRK